MEEPPSLKSEIIKPQEPIEFNFGRTHIKYIPIDYDATSDPTIKEAQEQIAAEIPNNDVIIPEYFPPEVSEDFIFSIQSIRFPRTANLAAQHLKPVLVVDPAYDSQFLVDFRGVPLTTLVPGAYLLAKSLEEIVEDKDPTSRRNFLKQLVGFTVGTTLSFGYLTSMIVGEAQLRNQPNTAIPAEGTIRRIIVSRGIQKCADYLTEDPNKQVKALLVYPDWIKLALTRYINDPDILERDFELLSQMKKVPRLQHYFQARLYTPERTEEGGVKWEKSVCEIT